jgi:hypothetical protein
MATSKISRPLLGVHKKRTRVQLLQPCCVTRLPRLCPHWRHPNIVVRRDYSSPGGTGSTSTSLCVTSNRLPAAAALHQLCRVPRLLVSRPRCLYHNYIMRLGASARRAARRRLLRLHHASGCLGTSRGSSHHSSSTTSFTPRVWVPQHVVRLVIVYFDYVACPGASARRAARCTARRQLHLRRASECLGTSRGSSRRSSSTTPTPCVRVPWHVPRLVSPLVVD